jgi:hypothetical protein
MGYCTKFKLTWDDTLPEPTIAAIVAKWRSEHPDAAYCIDDDGSSEERGCWYDFRANVRELSLRAPGVLFTLDCEGEDGTRWRTVAKDGKLFCIAPETRWAATPISPEDWTRPLGNLVCIETDEP